MRSAYLFGAALAAVVAATSYASAQGYRDDPPGWAFQKRGIVEDLNGEDPFNHGRGYYYGNRYYRWRGDYAYGRPYRNYRRDRRSYRD